MLYVRFACNSARNLTTARLCRRRPCYYVCHHTRCLGPFAPRVLIPNRQYKHVNVRVNGGRKNSITLGGQAHTIKMWVRPASWRSRRGGRIRVDDFRISEKNDLSARYQVVPGVGIAPRDLRCRRRRRRGDPASPDALEPTCCPPFLPNWAPMAATSELLAGVAMPAALLLEGVLEIAAARSFEWFRGLRLLNAKAKP